MSFECKACQKRYEEIVRFDKTGKYPKVVCPECGSKKKIHLIDACQFNFANPVDTDIWNSDSGGHDYRFKHNIPKVQQERKMAETMSHMGATPYKEINDLDLDVGIHDPETRGGLS